MQSVNRNTRKITKEEETNLMNEIKWGEPRPLRQSADAIPFPLDALPTVLRNMAQSISVTTSTDVGMAGTAMLSAVGYCFTGLYWLAGKADHTEPPVLYSIIIAQSSERKSPVMHFIKASFDSFESKYNGGIPNLDLLLKAWNGEKYICNRVIRGRTEIPRPYLSVALAGQPYIWDNMMNDTAFRSSGLIARFVPCFAKSDVGNRRYDTEPIQGAISRFHSSASERKERLEWRRNDTVPVPSCFRGVHRLLQ